MRKSRMNAFVAVLVAGASSFSGHSAQAQHIHRHQHVAVNRSVPTSHHHHDAMGHRIDDAGHHIDLYGRHTGNVGVYDNGARSYTTYNGNSGYWSNGNFIYATPPVGVVGSPAVQNFAPAQQQVIASRPPQNVLPGSVVPISNAGGKIKVLNLADSGSEIRYSLNGSEYSIKPGYAQYLDSDRQWVIEFGSGGTKGDVRYTLSPGTFKFKITETGWDLVRAADQQAIAETGAELPAPAPVPQPDGPSLNPFVTRP